MKIFPAIDIKNGKCVRLLKGDFNKSTEYKKTPIDQAKEFSDLIDGSKTHIIKDCSGAPPPTPLHQFPYLRLSLHPASRIASGTKSMTAGDSPINSPSAHKPKPAVSTTIRFPSNPSTLG